MIHYLYKLFRRVVISFGLLYAYNMFMNQFNLPIPINVVTLSITTLLGIPGFIGMIVFYILNFR